MKHFLKLPKANWINYQNGHLHLLSCIVIIPLFLIGCNDTPSNNKTIKEKKEDRFRIKLIEKDAEDKVEVWIDGESTHDKSERQLTKLRLKKLGFILF